MLGSWVRRHGLFPRCGPGIDTDLEGARGEILPPPLLPKTPHAHEIGERSIPFPPPPAKKSCIDPCAGMALSPPPPLKWWGPGYAVGKVIGIHTGFFSREERGGGGGGGQGSI